MNTNILQKCLDELGKENPKLDYVRGMLETLIEMQGGKTLATVLNSTLTAKVPVAPIDPETALLQVPMGRMEEIKKLTNESI